MQGGGTFYPPQAAMMQQQQQQQAQQQSQQPQTEPSQQPQTRRRPTAAIPIKQPQVRDFYFQVPEGTMGIQSLCLNFCLRLLSVHVGVACVMVSWMLCRTPYQVVRVRARAGDMVLCS